MGGGFVRRGGVGRPIRVVWMPHAQEGSAGFSATLAGSFSHLLFLNCLVALQTTKR